MFKFNSDHILTGHIKQVLSSFNLPSYRIYTTAHHKYFVDNGVESPELADGLYIKQGSIREYKDGKWGKDLDHYGYNIKHLNHTKNFIIQNNIYDSDTHEYLGDFLRFQRDYLGIDLMPLYNCFSNRVCNNLELSIDTKQTKLHKVNVDPDTKKLIPEYIEETKKLQRVFWSDDKNYIIYMIPIKFFKQYTIAIDSEVGAEICCGFYSDYFDTIKNQRSDLVLSPVPMADASQFIANKTYKKYTDLRFNNPILWSGISAEDVMDLAKECADSQVSMGSYEKAREYHIYKQRLLDREGCLKLFLKVPITVDSSIVILEGDYRDYNNMTYAPRYIKKYRSGITTEENVNGSDYVEKPEEEEYYTYGIWEKKQNRTITNYETELLGERFIENPSTRAVDVVLFTTELPEVEDRPFNPISPLQLLKLNTKTSYPFSDRLIEYLTGNVVTEWDENIDNIRRTQKVMELNSNTFALNGAWEGKMRNIIYDYMMGGKPSGELFSSDINHEIFGYVDKDVEKYYTAWGKDFCRDENGDKIHLTVKEPIVDENGQQIVIFDEKTGRWVPQFEEVKLYQVVNKILTDNDVESVKEVLGPIVTETGAVYDRVHGKVLLENRNFVLTAQDQGVVPLYKTKFVPLGTIANIDIYDTNED